MSAPVGLDRVLARIAVEEAAARGEQVDEDALVTELDRLARGVRMPPTCPIHQAVARINLHLFDSCGFGPATDDYGHPSASLLDQVLARKRGLPIVLCLVYMEVGRRCGVELDGVGFPGHFLVSPRRAEPRFFLDPYHQGRVLDVDRLHDQLARLRRRRVRADELESALQPVGEEHIRIRLDNNLKGAYLREDDIDGAIRASARILAVSPHLQGEQRDLALMRVHQGRRDEAIAGLDAYLAAWPDAREADDLRALRDELAG
ncbi:MAG: tetratricopeptide repeat protein [Alphaproteobacteria bacterium]|nr:tetratricopeptide repeat protein [Alphaproteobacteria bacterium]MCB9693984.1 tetratricopeptide repeat protein [Alphaproteobacteria bacterium]